MILFFILFIGKRKPGINHNRIDTNKNMYVLLFETNERSEYSNNNKAAKNNPELAT